MKQHIQTLEQHNVWRRRDGDEPIEMVNPTVLGIAIDEVVKAAKRYEEVRLWSVPAFKEIYCRSIAEGLSFDGLVDAEIAKREARK